MRQKVKELKDELFENLKEKYNDQIQDGKTEQEAYNSVISGIGDLSELIESVKEPYSLPSELIEEKEKSLKSINSSCSFYNKPFPICSLSCKFWHRTNYSYSFNAHINSTWSRFISL